MKRKKTEHTIISHNFRNSEHQNIHVMLFYAIITKQTNAYQHKSDFVIALGNAFKESWYDKKREKKRSTQSSLASSETQSVKIFTSCCLMQLYLYVNIQFEHYVIVCSSHTFHLDILSGVNFSLIKQILFVK